MKFYQGFFPLRSSQNVLSFLKHLIANARPPDLAYFSIFLGILEHSFQNGDERFEEVLSSIDFKQMHGLFRTFLEYLQDPAFLGAFQKAKKTTAIGAKISANKTKLATEKKNKRSQIKGVADAVWWLLARNYRKDRPRMHSLYSLLKGAVVW